MSELSPYSSPRPGDLSDRSTRGGHDPMSSSTGAPARDTVNDRRRAREERGLAPAASRGDRLPPPPRERRPALAVLAVLLIVGGAAVAGLLALRADTRVRCARRRARPARGARRSPQATSPPRRSRPRARCWFRRRPRARSSASTPGSPSRTASSSTRRCSPRRSRSRPARSRSGAALGAGRMPASGLQAGDIVQLVGVGDAARQPVRLGDRRQARVSSTRDRRLRRDVLRHHLRDVHRRRERRLRTSPPSRPPATSPSSCCPAARRSTGQLTCSSRWPRPRARRASRTTARVLASIWPSECILVDADPAGGDIALLSRTAAHEPLDPERGLLSLAVAARRGAEQAPVGPHLQVTDGGLDVLCGVNRPEQVAGMGPVWPTIGEILRRQPGHGRRGRGPAAARQPGHADRHRRRRPALRRPPAGRVLRAPARAARLDRLARVEQRGAAGRRAGRRRRQGPHGPRPSSRACSAHSGLTNPGARHRRRTTSGPPPSSAGGWTVAIDRSLLVRSARQLVEPIRGLASMRASVRVGTA